jgi:hypothetical protein
MVNRSKRSALRAHVHAPSPIPWRSFEIFAPLRWVSKNLTSKTPSPQRNSNKHDANTYPGSVKLCEPPAKPGDYPKAN